MNKKLSWTLKFLVIFSMVAASCYFFDSVPAEMPIHWNFEGQVDKVAKKEVSLFMLPALAFFIVLLFPLVKLIDPRKEKYKQFEKTFEIMQFSILLFFAYMHFLSIYLVFYPEKSINPFMLGGLGTLFIVMGNYFGKIRQNYFIGIRTPWTLNNEEVWNKTHRFGGMCFVVSGFMLIANIFLHLPNLPVLIAAVLIAALCPVVYSYFMYKKLT